MNKLQIARVAHEVNRAYCASLGDTSQPSWDDAPGWQRDSAIAGVEMHLANPDATPEQSHEAWLERKLAEGWVHGETKDVEKKQHPCVLPYDDLPPEQKAKDYLFRGVVLALTSLPAVVSTAEAPEAHSVPVHGAEIEYVGRRDTHTDGLYGTGAWVKGQKKVVPPALAVKMAKHADVFRKGCTSATPAALASATVVSENPNRTETEEEIEQLEELRAKLGTMNRAGLQDFVQTHYQQKIDGRLSTEATLERVLALVNQYGLQ